MLPLLLLAAAFAPPPSGSPSITIGDLARGDCSISVVRAGDDALSSIFNEAVEEAASKSEAAFCSRAKGNFVVYTNGHVRPTGRAGDHFLYRLTAHEVHDFIASDGKPRTLASEIRECRALASTCARDAVQRLLKTLEAR